MTKQTSKQTAFAIDDNGRGIVRIGDKTVFVDNLLTGEEGQITTTYKFGKLKYAKLDKRLSNSPDRVKPNCPYYYSCGGCNLMHLAYPKQLEYKQQKVQNLLHKFAHIDMEVSPTVGMNNPYHFRNKIQVPIRMNSEGKIISGFFKQKSHDIIEIDECLIESKKARHILESIKRNMTKLGILPYDEVSHSGIIRHAVIKTSLNFKQVMLVIVTTKKDFPNKQEFVNNVYEECTEINTFIQNVNPKITNVILGDEEEVLIGRGKIQDSILGMNFLISSRSFYQTNPVQTEKLYELAIKASKLDRSQNVLDAYSGIGTIGLCASSNAKSVTCVEIVESAVQDAENNAKLNDVSNVEFIKEDCTKFILENKVEYDVVFLDPPRKGSTPDFLKALVSIKPNRIIYISCNPVTLSRDLTYLKESYNIESVTPVDMFPHSAHVECVVSLKLNK